MKKTFTDEEHQFEGSDDDELLQTGKGDSTKPEKAKKKLTKDEKKRRHMGNDAHDSDDEGPLEALSMKEGKNVSVKLVKVEKKSNTKKNTKKKSQLNKKDGCDDMLNSDDDDLPEAFSMEEARTMAQQRKSDEQASGKRIAEEVKRRKQERTAKRMEEKKRSRKSEKPSSAIEPTLESTSTPSKVTGFLDDNIVQFLSERERTKLDSISIETPAQMNVSPKKAGKRRKGEQKESRVQVMVLSADPGKVSDHSALQFKREHLYGDRIKRDACMLKV